MTLADFNAEVEKINHENRPAGPLFDIVVSDGGNPVSLKVGFAKGRHSKAIQLLYDAICVRTRQLTNGAAFVESSEELFRNGIIGIAINRAQSGFNLASIWRLVESLNGCIVGFNRDSVETR